MPTTESSDAAVSERYSRAARETEPALCCPVRYDPRYLHAIPDEILERDYGCGDPSEYVREGDTVLDLGSGSGKIFYIASQIVGPSGRVIGVDASDDMLALANRHRRDIGDRIGFHNVEFRKGRIEDLSLDPGLVDAELATRPVCTTADLGRLDAFCASARRERPLVADDSVDVVLSNCVLNLVSSERKEQLFREMFRVVRRGGRVAISDIVSDEDVPEDLKRNPELWSGCISGAYREDEFVAAFDRAGFYGIEIVKRDERPWQTVRGIEFRSVTVVAHKGKQGPCIERRQAVIYRGPWRSVTDDDGHVLERGQRTAVCDKTFQIFGGEPYARDLLPVEPYEAIAVDGAKAFDCSRPTLRSALETKGSGYDGPVRAQSASCAPGGDCC